MLNDKANITIAIKYEVVYGLSINISLVYLKVKVKVIYNSSAIVTKLVTDKLS